MKVDFDAAALPSPDDDGGKKFQVALDNSTSQEDQLSALVSQGVVSVMGNIMMRLAGDVLSDGLSDDD
jgi:hypothetical protein